MDFQWMDLFIAMDKFLLDMAMRHGMWVYVALFAIFFSETGLVFMTFLPGDSLLFVAGAVAASGAMNVWILIAVVVAGAILGNTLNYFIGSWLGRKVYDGTITWIDQGALKTTHDFYEKHGGKTIVIARFVPIVRSFAPLVAGAGGMDFRRFQVSNVVGAVLWVLTLVGGGHLFGQVPLIRDNLGAILILGIGVVLVPLALVGLWRSLRRRSNDRPQGAAMKPVAATARPPAPPER